MRESERETQPQADEDVLPSFLRLADVLNLPVSTTFWGH